MTEWMREWSKCRDVERCWQNARNCASRNLHASDQEMECIYLNGKKRDREREREREYVITNGLESACLVPSHCQIPDLGRVLEPRTNSTVRRLYINWWSSFSVSFSPFLLRRGLAMSTFQFVTSFDCDSLSRRNNPEQVSSAGLLRVNILGYLDRSRYFFFQVAPQLYSRGWVDPVPDPLLLRKSGSVGNRTLPLDL
jgi:hypothetical protein